MFKSVGLVARFDKKRCVKLAQELDAYLSGKGLKVYIEDTLDEKMTTDGKSVPLEKLNSDFIITLGGDGTILRTCLSIPKPEPPILAINMGVRGFLTEVPPKQAFTAVDRVLGGDFQIEKRMKLSVTGENAKFPDALNEVVVSADEPAKLLYTRILKNQEHILDCQSDGLMAATQTGSTGYSLSAGGPVLDLEVNSFVLTPVCPLGLFHPVVFPANSRIAIEIVKPRRISVLVDGRHRQFISSRRPSLTVTRSKYETSFIRFKSSFYNRLRSRLLFKG